MSKILGTILKFSLSSLLLGGCIAKSFTKEEDNEKIFFLKNAPLKKSAKHYHFSRSFYPTGEGFYKSDLLFVLDCAKKE